MSRDLPLLGLAALLVVTANLHLCCRVAVGGENSPALYSPAAVHRGLRAAEAAAEELQHGEAVLPELQTRYVLSFSPPGGTAGALSDRILRATDGVSRLTEVLVGERRCGTVRDAAVLSEGLRAHLYSCMPTAAVSGRYALPLSFRDVYARSGTETPPEDMVLLVSGAAPVWYQDAEGNEILG